MDTPRLAPLELDDMDGETRALLATSLHADDDTPLNIFATIAHHPKLLKRWLVFGNHVLTKSTLPPRDRELLILRTGWLCRSDYEWGQHAVIARQVGINDEEIARVGAGPTAPGWDAFDAALLSTADELHATGTITEATWATLSTRYDAPQLLDAIFAVGQYHTVSFALNSTGVPLDTGIDGLPDAARQAARLYRVVLPVAGVDDAAEAYGRLLAQPGRRVSPGRHYLDAGSVILALVDPRADGDDYDARRNLEPVYLAVDDLEAATERGRAAGFEVTMPIAVRPWGERSAYLRDAWGNPVCLVDAQTVFTG